MVAYRPGKAYGSSPLYETVFKGTPRIGQEHALMLVGIGQLTAAVGGIAVAIGERHQHRHLCRRVGRIDQVQVEPVALTVLIHVRIIIYGGVIVVVRNVAVDAITLQ